MLQGVDNSLVGLHNQSFARVMEQRLAQLFMMSQQQGRRFKRATTLGSYTVQVGVREAPGASSFPWGTCCLRFMLCAEGQQLHRLTKPLALGVRGRGSEHQNREEG